jgi:hypothetical protein
MLSNFYSSRRRRVKVQSVLATAAEKEADELGSWTFAVRRLQSHNTAVRQAAEEAWKRRRVSERQLTDIARGHDATDGFDQLDASIRPQEIEARPQMLLQRQAPVTGARRIESGAAFDNLEAIRSLTPKEARHAATTDYSIANTSTEYARQPGRHKQISIADQASLSMLQRIRAAQEQLELETQLEHTALAPPVWDQHGSAFTEFDENGDGVIDRREWGRALARGHRAW